jgi:hypothetical protein
MGRKNQPDVSAIVTIAEIYAYLDEQALQLDRDHYLLDVLVEFRNRDWPAADKQALQWEVEAFFFNISGGSLFSFSYSTGLTMGEVKEFPVLDEFQKTGFDYLTGRAAAANNPLLTARYNHILWRAGILGKNSSFARAAILANVAAIRQNLEAEDADNEHYFQVSTWFERLAALCGEVKAGLDEARAVAHSILFEYPVPFFARHAVLKAMLGQKAVFKPADFASVLAVFEAELQGKMDAGDPFLWTRNYFETAIAVARKTEAGLKDWYERWGDYYVLIAERETDDARAWMKYDAYSSAIAAYRNAGHLVKRKQIEQSLLELKPKVKLPTVRIERPPAEIKRLQNMAKFMEGMAKALLTQPPEVIYSSLIKGWYYPQKEMTKERSEKEEYFYEKYLTPVFFDRNKNITKGKDEDHSQKKFYDFYNSYIQNVTTGYLYYVFIPGIASGRLTYRNFIAYLAEHTWLGKPYIKTDLGGSQLQLNWLTMISPAIIEYFVQVQAWQLSTSYPPNFMLAIDSLTLKMEGLFRNFSEQVKVSTTVGGKDGLQEVYLHNVLENPAIIKYFNEDDLQFFKYLFANEGGINLRNNVAHCYYHFADYHLDKFHLLLAALIKIAQYTFEEIPGDG